MRYFLATILCTLACGFAAAGDLPLRPELLPLIGAQQIQRDEIAPMHLNQGTARQALAEFINLGYRCQIDVTDDSHRGHEFPSDLLCTLVDSKHHPGCETLLVTVQPDWPPRSKDRADLYQRLSAPVQWAHAFCAPLIDGPKVAGPSSAGVEQLRSYAKVIASLHGDVAAVLQRVLVDGLECGVMDSSGSLRLDCQGQIKSVPDCDNAYLSMPLLQVDSAPRRRDVILQPSKFRLLQPTATCDLAAQ